MVELKNRKMAKKGDDYIVSIPRNYIRDGILDPEIRYNIELKEVKPDENKQTESNTRKGTTSISD